MNQSRREAQLRKGDRKGGSPASRSLLRGICNLHVKRRNAGAGKGAAAQGLTGPRLPMVRRRGFVGLCWAGSGPQGPRRPSFCTAHAARVHGVAAFLRNGRSLHPGCPCWRERHQWRTCVIRIL